MTNELKNIGFGIVSPLFFVYYKLIQKKFPKVCDSIETLDHLITTGKSFSRFGDGEFNIICGKGIGFQKQDSKLASELVRVLTVRNDRCALGIPNVFNGFSHFNRSSAFFWLYKICCNWHKWSKYMIYPKYFDALSSRFYIDHRDKNESYQILERWKRLWNDRDVVIVEGSLTKMGIGNDLFDNVRSLKRIICPSKDAFSKYSEILNAVSSFPKTSLILIALGPAASILAYDISLLGYQAIDSGHLDLEYNWMVMGTTKKVAVAGRFVNEISNEIILDVDDSEYCKQISHIITE